MANNQTPDEATGHVDATVVTTAPVSDAAPAATKSTGARWTLASFAAVGLLGLGLLGGILIGQHMAPPGLHNDGAPNRSSVQQGGPGQNERIPDRLRERMRDNLREHLQERRDERMHQERPENGEPSDNG